MADFKTHLTIGSAVGFLIAVFGYVWDWIGNVSMAIIVFILTSIASFLPDTDSDSGLPVKIIFTVYGYFVAGLIIYYGEKSGLGLFFSLIMSAIAFGLVITVVAGFFRKYTKHRGIFHSIPAALIVFFLTLLFLKNSAIPETTRFFIAFGVFSGYLVHLILDEIWSLEFITTEEGQRYLHKKRSFGTALDFGFSGNQPIINGIVAWALVFILFLVTLPTIKKIYFAFLY